VGFQREPTLSFVEISGGLDIARPEGPRRAGMVSLVSCGETGCGGTVAVAEAQSAGESEQRVEDLAKEVRDASRSG